MNSYKRLFWQMGIVLGLSVVISMALQSFKIKSLKRLNTQRLDVKIAVSALDIGAFSIQHESSDFNINQVLLNSLISTLVKYDSTGRIAPYLAKSWMVSKNKKIWRFEFQDQFTCEDGRKITPDFFKTSLVRSLKKAKRFENAAFSNLEGWDRFKQGHYDSLGVYANKNYFYMEFKNPPEDLLDLLRLPYFGVWCNTSDKPFVSSGPFKVKSFRGNEVIIDRRADWQHESQGNIPSIRFSFTEIDQINPQKKSQLVKLPYRFSQQSSGDAFLVSSVPDRMEGFVLSPFKKGIFSDPVNRKIFRDRLRNLSQEYGLSQHFYVNNDLSLLPFEKKDYSASPWILKNKKQVVKVGFERINYSPVEIATIKSILGKIFANKKVSLEFEVRSPKSWDFMKRSLSNKYFDIRVSAVGVGAGIQTSSLSLIFCSSSSINFPDPSGKICRLVKQQSQDSTRSEQQFIYAFHKILKEDAVVMPLFHYQENWLVSSNVDPSGLSSSVIYPRFENLTLNYF